MLRCDWMHVVPSATAVNRSRGLDRLCTSLRRGFTQLELLVAIGIIGLLMALLVPAVQSAREASRRTQCQNNLHNLGIAIAGYESTHGLIPPAQGQLHAPSFPSKLLVSTHVLLLPYLDQAPLSEMVPQTPAGALQSNSEQIVPPYDTVIPVFQCPSDPTPLGTNYRDCLGAGFRWHQINDEGVQEYWVFSSAHPGLRAAEIVDGLSNTAAMSERIKSDLNTAEYSPTEDYFFSGAVDVFGFDLTRDELLMACGSLSGPPAAFDSRVGHTWHASTFGSTEYTHLVGPNSPIVDCAENAFSFQLDSYGGVHKASSRHPGGVQVLMADGAVRFVSDAIDLEVWRALGRRADGA